LILSFFQPLFDAVISSHPVQVIIPIHAEKGTIDEIKKHVIDTILAVVSKVRTKA
jgi:hypothetical protein